MQEAPARHRGLPSFLGKNASRWLPKCAAACPSPPANVHFQPFLHFRPPLNPTESSFSTHNALSPAPYLRQAVGGKIYRFVPAGGRRRRGGSSLHPPAAAAGHRQPPGLLRQAALPLILPRLPGLFPLDSPYCHSFPYRSAPPVPPSAVPLSAARPRTLSSPLPSGVIPGLT